MRPWDRLKKAKDYIRELRLSRDPDSYSRYKGRREHERKNVERERERAEDYAEHEREQSERERGYEERYTAERDHDIARERTERAEEIEPDR